MNTHCRGDSGCPNEARYYVRDRARLRPEKWNLTYCGLCDIKYNDGAGKLLRELESEGLL